MSKCRVGREGSSSGSGGELLQGSAWDSGSTGLCRGSGGRLQAAGSGGGLAAAGHGVRVAPRGSERTSTSVLL